MIKHFPIGKHIRFFLGDYLLQQRNASLDRLLDIRAIGQALVQGLEGLLNQL